MSVQNLCRTCLTPSKNMHLIFDGTQQGDATNVVVEVLQTFVKCSITPTDNASQYICSDCLKKMYDTYAFMLQCRQSDTAFRQLTESQVSLKRLKDPIEFVEYVIEDKGVDINMTNDVNGLENANEDGVVYNGHYSNAEPQSFDLTADSDKEIQSGEEEVGDEILECPACLDAFGMISVLRTHLIEVHTMDSMCIMCNNEHFEDIWNHTKIHVPKKQICTKCGKKFVKKRSLEKHQAAMCSSGVLMCWICRIRFENLEDLDEHFEQTHRLHCNICYKSFSVPWNMVRHKRIHLKLHSFCCTRSGRKYKRQKNFSGHLAAHSRLVGTKRLGTELPSFDVGDFSTVSSVTYDSDAKICAQLCPMTGEWKRTCHKQEGEVMSDSTAKEANDEHRVNILESTFVNDNSEGGNPRRTICSRLVCRKSGVASHKIIHTDEQPFSCCICKKQFRLKGGLKQHMISHSRIKPYICGICGRRFKKGAYVLKHIRSRHCHAEYFPCGLCKMVLVGIENLSRHWRSHAFSYKDVNVHLRKENYSNV